MPSRFRVDAPFKPAGDQPQAISQLVEGVRSGLSQQVLLGVTGSGKTNVMSWVVEELQRPVLVLSPNKTLAAQLCAEFRRLLPNNAVEYFVSYYDYYQPEAYIARTDTYIEKDSSRNDDIDRMRHSTTQNLLTRRDVLVVASVSCIYGIGSVEDYMGESLKVEKGQSIRREVFLRKLTEMLRETGTCAGIENYSRHLTRRQPGEAPYTLMDFLPDDTIIFVDESHVAVPQIGGMLGGDRSRKAALVEYGFRLPSAFDNRPLSFDEWEERAPNVIYVSATPGDYEMRRSQRTVGMLVRPTGSVAPTAEVPPTAGQSDDLLAEVKRRAELGHRSLVTTLTKRFAEDLADYLREYGVKVRYLHSELDAMERIDVLRDLRTGAVDVVVGINLLREGLDLPEVAFIGILDADKEGYLRAYRSFIQIIGRAARNVEGHVVMYADSITDCMRRALDETERRRNRQIVYNAERGITPESVKKAIYALEINEKDIQADAVELTVGAGVPREDLLAIARDLEQEMRRLSKELQFEDAARGRDRIIALRKRLAGEESGKEDDADVALAIAAAPKQKTMVRNWRKSRRGP